MATKCSDLDSNGRSDFTKCVTIQTATTEVDKLFDYAGSATIYTL